MPSITYVEHNGTEHTIDVPVGTSLMQGAVNHMIPGIEGDCGGLCACGTCHVYVDSAYQALTGTPDELEQGMLEFAFDVDDSSRLSCQITVTEAMEGMRVRMPARQY
ncbi:MAG: 2Fe-2S iron-sulfur cluster-binding protein [Pseudomonadales bacterium]